MQTKVRRYDEARRRRRKHARAVRKRICEAAAGLFLILSYGAICGIDHGGNMSHALVAASIFLIFGLLSAWKAGLIK